MGDPIGHMTAQHYGWTAAAAGHGADLSCWQPGPPAADPVGEYAAAAGLAGVTAVTVGPCARNKRT